MKRMKMTGFRNLSDILDEVHRLASVDAEAVEDRLTQCKELQEQAKDTFEATGEDKETYAQIVYAVADFLSDNYGDDIATELYLRHLALCEELYGPDSIQSIDTLSNIGAIYIFNDPKTALKYLMKALEIREKSEDIGKDEVAKNCWMIAFVLKNVGNFQLSVEFLEKAQKLYAACGKMDEVVSLQQQIARTYEQQGLFEKAIQRYEKILEWASERGEVSADLDVASVHNAIGLIFSKRGENERALYYITRAAEIAEKTQGYFNEDTGSYYNNAGVVCARLSDFHGMSENIEKALEIRKKVLDMDDLKLAETYTLYGLVQASRGNIPLALSNFYKSLAIKKKMLGSDSEEVKRYKELVSIFTKKGWEKFGEKFTLSKWLPSL